MQLTEIEHEIKRREEYLTRCLFNMQVLSSSPEEKEIIRLMEQEAFFLRDQLDKYYSVYSILREEQEAKDELLLQKA